MPLAEEESSELPRVAKGNEIDVQIDRPDGIEAVKLEASRGERQQWQGR